MRKTKAAMFVAVLFLVPGMRSYGEDGFRLAGGDHRAGKAAFEALNCTQCHKVSGVDLAAPKGKRRLDLTLGEEVRFVRRYEDIVTAIVNPQHVVAERYAGMLEAAGFSGNVQAYMPDFLDDMSVRQLLDIVAFLDRIYRDNPDYGKAGGE